ncbi:MAG: PilN domain-containing protein [Deltaproteobacteria bacterium]|nr:PilN domain-containing protein [Deltaproteobacteria bacterium]
MIRINLLPTKSKFKKEIFIFHMIVLAGLCVVSAVMYFVLLDAGINKKISHEEQYITRLNTQIKSLDSVIKKVDDFKKQKADLEKKIKTIKQLNAQRTGPVNFMEEFAIILPEKLWINTFKEEGRNLSLDGIAVDGPTVELFVDELRDSGFFTTVTLESVTQESSNGVNLQKFVIKCGVTYTPGAV